MHVVIFGLTVSSSWGNGHATLWRSLIKAMLRRGHTVAFFEKNVPYYEAERDLSCLPEGGELYLYDDFNRVRGRARREVDAADLALCTSFCPDGVKACDVILESKAAIKAFYDLDTPVTLAAVSAGESPAYLPAQGLSEFDVVLSYTGGLALEELQSRLGARMVAPLYGSVDPENHRPVAAQDEYRSALSYLGTYAEDRQVTLQRLFVEPAERLRGERFLIGGAQYPASFLLASNVSLIRHVPPAMHSAFFSSSRTTLNVTRSAMARYGYCPSGRLFEAAACGVPLLSDSWEGLEDFFTPDEEILRVDSTDSVVQALSLTDGELRSMARLARERALSEHTGECRVRELEQICETVLHHASHLKLEAV